MTPLQLTQEEREELEQLLAESRFSLWSPSRGPQMEAYFSQADELFYGGAAGGGKTSLIMGLALTAHQRSLILRRESTQLRGFIDDLARILKTRDGMNKQDGQWRIPATLAQFPDQLIEFGGVPNPGDEERHQGIPHDLLAFDEVTQIPEYVVDYLSTWCRTTTRDQRTRVVLTSNPPTPSTAASSARGSMGGLWLLRRYAPWLDPQYRDPYGLGKAQPGELRWYVTLNGQDTEWPDPMPFEQEIKAGPRKGEVERVLPRSRTFIPSLPTDNPYLDENYIATLQKRPEPLRSALLYGDFSVSLVDTPMALFPSEWVRAAVARWVAMTDTRPAFHQPMAPYHPPGARMTGLGVDVARGGADATIAVACYGRTYFTSPVAIPASVARTGPEVAGEVVKLRRDGAQLVIDANGVGASVYDTLASTIEEVFGYVGSTRGWLTDLSGSYTFPTLRAQSYWRLREALDPAAANPLAIPDDPDLIQELLAHNWEERGGKIHVTTKERVTDSLKRSPDRADALVLAHASSLFGDNADQRAIGEAQVRQTARELRLADADHNSRGASSAGVYDPWSPQHTPSATRERGRAAWSARELPYPKRY